jgi:GT2 family glycosyltransferase
MGFQGIYAGRKQAQTIGGFDKDFFMYCEDIDIC